jgi:ABC-type antimicrobial peptide transport system permease subunit
MNILSDYIRTAIYNIWHNKAYAVFCLFGTALTFVFIVILLQLVHVVTGNEPPLENANRIVGIEYFYGDTGPNHSWNKKYYFNEPDVIQLSSLVQGYECYGISHIESVNPTINGQLKTVVVNFVNPDYWQVKGFNFIKGRPFTEKDYSRSKPVAVIKESNARKYFGSPSQAMGKEIEFQGNIYQIIGIVEDFSLLAADEWSGIWAPHKYNKGVPSGWMNYAVEYLFPKKKPVNEMKENVLRAVKHHLEGQGKEIVEPAKLQTNREQIIEKLGDTNRFRYGITGIILVLLIIPAINIVTLNMANARKHAEEIAVRKALGASKSLIFFQLMSETILLVLFGTLLGFFLSFPALHIIESCFLDYGTGEGAKLLGEMDYGVILWGVFPISLLFSFMAGGVPAWKVIRLNVAEALKGKTGDEKLIHKNQGFIGIYIEQALVFIALMICGVSIFKKVELYRMPGMLDTDNTLIFGYAASAQNENFNWDDVKNAMSNMKAINEELKTKNYIEGISKNNNMLPYGASSDGMTFTIEANGKRMQVDFMAADEDAFKVLKPTMDEGKWFSDDDYKNPPSIITRQLADSIKWVKTIGQTIKLPLSDSYSINTQVTGVVSGIKKDVFEKSKMGFIIPASLFAQFAMTASGYYCVRLTGSNEKDNFTNEYYSLFKKRIGTNTCVEPVVSDLDRYKMEQIIKNTSDLIAQTVPTVFFLIFGFIGSLGLFWLNTKKRIRELALRRAVGSTKMQIFNKVLYESLFLTLLAALPGIVLSFFIYDFRAIEIMGIGASLLIMLLFSVFSAWYPAYKSSGISPAESLHYE